MQDTLVEMIQTALARQVPAATMRLVNNDTLAIVAGPTQATVRLDQIRRGCTDPATTAAAAAKVAANVKAMIASASGETRIDAAVLRPMLKTDLWIEQTRAQLAAHRSPESNWLVTAPFGGGLTTVFVVDKPAGVEMVSRGDAAALGLDDWALAAHACQNLAAAFPQLPPMREIPGAGVWTNTTIEDYAAAMLLLPERWSSLVDEVGGTLIVAAPARNVVFATAPRSGERHAAFVHNVKRALAQEAYPLVATLFQWSPSGFRPITA